MTRTFGHADKYHQVTEEPIYARNDGINEIYGRLDVFKHHHLMIFDDKIYQLPQETGALSIPY